MPVNQPRRQLSGQRKLLYYSGMSVCVIGALLFLSTFVTFLANFGNFNNFDAQVRSGGYRAFGGIVLIMAGGFLANLGARGWAGAGVVLDPERARRDIEPWSRMAGGIVQDALSETALGQANDKHRASEPVVKVRCPKCQALNNEDSHFCSQCGAAL
ncbi:MAG: zinc-ribbon domain-containing protein [Pirellulales bacterium]